MSKSREPHFCEHGNLYVYSKRLGTKTKDPGGKPSYSSMKRSEPDRDWTDARAKVDEEGCCRICKRTDRKLEAAHVLGREHDEPKVSEATGNHMNVLYVDPDRIFPACGPFPDGCHGDVDLHRINYLPYLTLEEQVRAVRDAGGIEPARIRLEPVTHREAVEAEAFRPEALDESSSPSSAWGRAS
jgi:hypothetical protein